MSSTLSMTYGDIFERRAPVCPACGGTSPLALLTVIFNDPVNPDMMADGSACQFVDVIFCAPQSEPVWYLSEVHDGLVAGDCCYGISALSVQFRRFRFGRLCTVQP
eukprot:m.549370 g.549370  ORF g.549370 m.549370 type:complete len:106 (+) comp22159_c0_seq1:2096-2413(+)